MLDGTSMDHIAIVCICIDLFNHQNLIKIYPGIFKQHAQYFSYSSTFCNKNIQKKNFILQFSCLKDNKQRNILPFLLIKIQIMNSLKSWNSWF